MLVMGAGLTEINYCLTMEWSLSDVVTADVALSDASAKHELLVDTFMTPLGSWSHFCICQKLFKIGLVKNLGVRRF